MKARQNEAGLTTLLDAWIDAAPHDRQPIERELFDTFEESLAILVIDMSGFSATVVRHGIVHFLGSIRRMRRIATPIIPRYGGDVVKYIGDDVLAVFDDVDDAYRAADEILRGIHNENARMSSELQIELSMGIGYGPTLYVPQQDIWGNQGNQAFKLGEDTAGPGEIMMTEQAHERLTLDREDFEPQRITISGLEIASFVRRAQ